jgi:hypothetical protein
MQINGSADMCPDIFSGAYTARFAIAAEPEAQIACNSM